MRVHLLLAAALVLPTIISCANSEEAVLQQGRDSSGTPTKFRTRLAINLDGQPVAKDCIESVVYPAGVDPSDKNDAAKVIEAIKDQCHTENGKSVKGRGVRDYRWFYYDLSYFYDDNYYYNPYVNNYNQGCYNIFGSFGRNFNYDCYRYVANINFRQPVNYCVQYCYSAFTTSCSSCGGYSFAY